MLVFRNYINKFNDVSDKCLYLDFKNILIIEDKEILVNLLGKLNSELILYI